MFEAMKDFGVYVESVIGHDAAVFLSGALSMLFVILGVRINAATARMLKERGEG